MLTEVASTPKCISPCCLDPSVMQLQDAMLIFVTKSQLCLLEKADIVLIFLRKKTDWATNSTFCFKYTQKRDVLPGWDATPVPRLVVLKNVADEKHRGKTIGQITHGPLQTVLCIVKSYKQGGASPQKFERRASDEK